MDAEILKHLMLKRDACMRILSLRQSRLAKSAATPAAFPSEEIESRALDVEYAKVALADAEIALISEASTKEDGQ